MAMNIKPSLIALFTLSIVGISLAYINLDSWLIGLFSLDGKLHDDTYKVLYYVKALLTIFTFSMDIIIFIIAFNFSNLASIARIKSLHWHKLFIFVLILAIIIPGILILWDAADHIIEFNNILVPDIFILLLEHGYSYILSLIVLCLSCIILLIYLFEKTCEKGFKPVHTTLDTIVHIFSIIIRTINHAIENINLVYSDIILKYPSIHITIKRLNEAYRFCHIKLQSYEHTNSVLFYMGISVSFIIGILHTDGFSSVLNAAQVVAGLIDYPGPSLEKYAHYKQWSILVQLFAVLLKIGVSEKTISLITCGVQGALFFLAVFLIAKALIKSFYLAIIFSLFLLFSSLIHEVSIGLSYEIVLFSKHTYGIIGFLTSILIIGLFLNNHRRSCVLISGIFFSIHADWALWINISIIIYIVLNRDQLKPYLRLSLYYIFGVGISFVSYYVQYNIIFPDYADIFNQFTNPNIPLSIYREAARQYWFHHSGYWPAKNLLNSGYIICYLGLVASIYALIVKHRFNKIYITVSAIYIISMAMSFVPFILFNFGYILVPNFLSWIIFARHLEVHAFLALLTIYFSPLCRIDRKSKHLFLITNFLSVLFLLIWVENYASRLPLLLTIILTISIVTYQLPDAKHHQLFSILTDYRLLNKPLVILLFITALTGFSLHPPGTVPVDFLNRISKLGGYTLSSVYYFPNLQSFGRVPTASAPTFLYLRSSPEALPWACALAEDFYGLGAYKFYRKNNANINKAHNLFMGSIEIQQNLEQRTYTEWAILFDKYKFKNFVTYDYYAIQLPLIFKSDGYALYRIE